MPSPRRKDSPIRDAINARIKQLGLSIYQFAHSGRIAAAPSTVYRFLKGEVESNSGNLDEMLTALGLRIVSGGSPEWTVQAGKERLTSEGTRGQMPVARMPEDTVRERGKGRRPYEELQAIVEEEGGEMHFEREGRPPGGVWVVTLHGRTAEFKSNGAGFPRLDRLYVPKIPAPTHYRDYTNDLVDGAREMWLNMLR